MPLALDSLDHDTIVAWLRETDPVVLERLWARADAVRAANVGDAVHLRGLIEISNHCIATACTAASAPARTGSRGTA